MLDLGWQEFMLIGLIAVLVVGPKDLPNVIRTIMHWIRKVRATARDFQKSVEDVAREAELDDIRRQAQSLANQDIGKTIRNTVDPDGSMMNAINETRSAVEETRSMAAIGDSASHPPTESVTVPTVTAPTSGEAGSGRMYNGHGAGRAVPDETVAARPEVNRPRAKSGAAKTNPVRRVAIKASSPVKPASGKPVGPRSSRPAGRSPGRPTTGLRARSGPTASPGDRE